MNFNELPSVEKIEMNLDNPIFTVHVDVRNFPRERIEEILKQSKEMFDIYSNVTMWFVASDKTDIVCIYDGFARNRDYELKDLIEELNKKIEIMSESHSFDDFKINVRDWRLNSLID